VEWPLDLARPELMEQVWMEAKAALIMVVPVVLLALVVLVQILSLVAVVAVLVPMALPRS
jgi:hypothetical protein